MNLDEQGEDEIYQRLEMRILHIFDDYGTPGERALPGEGSVSSIVYYLAKYAVVKGHDVTILERDHGTLPETEIIDGIKFVRIKAGNLSAPPYRLIQSPTGLLKLLSDGYSVARKLQKFVKENNFDAIHVHFPFASSILITLNKELREKIVYTAHIGEETKRFNLSSKLPLALKIFSPDLYLMKRVKKNVVLNEPLKLKLVSKGFTEERLKVIPNGVAVDEYGGFSDEEIGGIKEKYGMTGKTTVLFVGTITPRKGVETLIKAAELLVNSYGQRDVLFLLVGNLSLDKEFGEKEKEYVKSHNLDIYIKFTGFVSREDLKVLYIACDFLILLSFEEGFAVALTEAMSSGKPLIGTNVGGIPMQVKDGWNGFLVEPNNEQQIADKMKYLVDHPVERERMGRNSRILAEEKFDWSKIIKSYLQVYEEMLDES